MLDSGVWISALQFGGVPMRAVMQCLSSHTVICTSGIEEEIVRTLEQKFQRSANANRTRLSILLQGAVQVSVSGILAGVCRDPNDNFVIECAVIGHAHLIVTGDHDLLALREYGSIRIVSPRQYLDLSQSS